MGRWVGVMYVTCHISTTVKLLCTTPRGCADTQPQQLRHHALVAPATDSCMPGGAR